MAPSAKELKAQKKLEKQQKRAAAKKDSGPSPPISKAPSASWSEPNHPVKTALFEHLEKPREVVASSEDVHPATLNLAIQMQQCNIIGSSARTKAMLECFEQVIRDYSTPSNSAINRSLSTHISKQIEVLKTGRALSVSMGNAIRWLKQQTSTLSPDLDEEGAKELLVEAIRGFIRDQIDIADRVIVDSTCQMIKPGSHILVYGHSQVVYLTLKEAWERDLDISVVVVDSNPLFEGKKLAAKLVDLGIPTQYGLLSSLPYLVDDSISTVLVGAHAMVSNGNLYSRVGTALIAMAVSQRDIPFLVLCETLKFSDRVQLDAFSINELIPKMDDSNTSFVFYDLTDSKYISKVVTEIGALPASSVPVIIREYKQLQ